MDGDIFTGPHVVDLDRAKAEAANVRVTLSR